MKTFKLQKIVLPVKNCAFMKTLMNYNVNYKHFYIIPQYKRSNITAHNGRYIITKWDEWIEEGETRETAAKLFCL